MNKYLIAIIGILIAAVTILWTRLDKVKAERNRLEINQTVIVGDLEHYKIRDSLNAISIQALNLSKDEISEYCEELTELLNEMSVKVKRMESATTTATTTKIKTEPMPIIKSEPDSLLVKPEIYAFEWEDRWSVVTGEIEDDMISLEVYTRDTLQQVIHRVPKKFWFIKYGTKAIRQEVVSLNPHSEIVYSEFIRLR